MDNDELYQVVDCWECGEPIPRAADAYWFNPDGALCLVCASRRGGEYDAGHDRWLRLPDTGDLPDERRQHP